MLSFFILKNTFSTQDMKQLELEFNSIDLSDHYVAHQVIDEGKNQIFSWSDTLSDDGKKLFIMNLFMTPQIVWNLKIGLK